MEVPESFLEMMKVIILSNSIAQTLAPGQSLAFDQTVLHTGCNTERHRRGSGTIVLNRQGIYEIGAKLNVTTTEVGEAHLAVVASDGTLSETEMVSTPAEIGDVNTVSCNTAIRPCSCCGETISIQNVGTIPVTVSPNACIFVKRIA